MINDSLVEPSAINTGAYNGSIQLADYYDYYHFTDLWSYSINFMFDFTILICIFGILGNGMVIWILGFRIKKNPLTIFILNLAIVDFGVLLATIMTRMHYYSFESDILANIFFCTILCMFSTSQMFLTVISVDRCVSVFLPLWHRCHRPTWLPTLLSALTWLLSFLTTIAPYISDETGIYVSSKVTIYLFFANSFLCLPLMTISSLMLFLKVCCKSGQQRRQKLLTTILVTVAFFLSCCFPFNIFILMLYLNEVDHFFYAAVFFACLKGTLNPFIYYLVGRRKKGHVNKSMKGVLQNLFKEDEI